MNSELFSFHCEDDFNVKFLFSFETLHTLLSLCRRSSGESTFFVPKPSLTGLLGTAPINDQTSSAGLESACTVSILTKNYNDRNNPRRQKW